MMYDSETLVTGGQHPTGTENTLRNDAGHELAAHPLRPAGPGRPAVPPRAARAERGREGLWEGLLGPEPRAAAAARALLASPFCILNILLILFCTKHFRNYFHGDTSGTSP